MNTLARFDCSKVFRNAILLISSLGLAVFSSISYSAYQYTYIGNTITGTFTQYHPDLPEPYNTPTISAFSGAVFVQFLSPTLLTGAIDMSNIDSFMMGGETTSGISDNGSIIGNWVYPYPYHVTAYSSYGEFEISTVDANGLPTDWDIKMFGDTGYTRHTYYDFETTRYLDKIYGYSEYGSEWSGEIVMASGQWKVTSMVPETRTYIMLLAGLGLIGFVYKRRRSV